MNKRLEEAINMEYIQKNGLWVVEEHVVSVHTPIIRLERDLDKAVEFGLDSLKGRVINTRV